MARDFAGNLLVMQGECSGNALAVGQHRQHRRVAAPGVAQILGKRRGIVAADGASSNIQAQQGLLIERPQYGAVEHLWQQGSSPLVVEHRQSLFLIHGRRCVLFKAAHLQHAGDPLPVVQLGGARTRHVEQRIRVVGGRRRIDHVAAARGKIEHGQGVAVAHADEMFAQHDVAVLRIARGQAGFHAGLVDALGSHRDVERDAGLGRAGAQEKDDGHAGAAQGRNKGHGE